MACGQGAQRDLHRFEDKVKFPKGTVVYAGSKEEAVKMIAEAYPEAPVVFADRHSGDS